MDLERDLNLAMNLINESYNNGSSFSRVYKNTNEFLNSIYKNFDFENKNVLSVIGSGDQVFSALYMGAKNVDCFDRNILAYYYLYLKKWCILNTKSCHLSARNDILLDSIKLHDNTNDEILAYEFWEYILNNINHSLYYSNFFHNDSTYYDVPYRENINKLLDKLEHFHPNYFNFNMFDKSKFNFNYDILIISNMLEYVYKVNDLDVHKNICNNLINLISDNGHIIASNLRYSDYKLNDLYYKYFEYINGEKNVDKLNNNIFYNLGNKPIYYVLKKK